MHVKNFWILNHYAVTPELPGSTRHYDFAKELVKRGYQVTIFASSFHYGLYKELNSDKNKWWKIEKINGINFVWIKTFPYKKNNWRRAINMISFLYRSYLLGRKITKLSPNIKKPNAILGSTVHLLTPLSAYWLSKYYQAMFIIEIRDLWPQTLIDIGKLKRISPLAIVLRILEKFLYKRAKKIIILSPVTKNYLKSIKINQNKIYLIPNGVDLSIFKNVPFVKREKAETFYIIYTGMIGVFIKLENALKTARIIQEKGVKNIKFIFVGSGMEKERLIKMKEKMRLTNVEFWKPVPKSKIPAILNMADLLLLMTNKVLYGSENKLMDYMASGKPILFALFDKHNNMADKIKCGISVAPENHQKMAEAIIKLYQMTRQERKAMGRRGQEYVKKYCSIPVLANKLEKVLNL